MNLHKRKWQGVEWEVLTSQGPWAIDDILGMLPDYLTTSDPRPAVEQFNERYAHGGGWRPHSQWKMTGQNNVLGPIIRFPGDPLFAPIAKATLRDESIYLYPSAFVAVVQANGDFVVSRMD